jgi:hypothetical protein
MSGSGLHDAQEGRRVGAIGEALLPIRRQHFQASTFCRQFPNASSYTIFARWLPVGIRAIAAITLIAGFGYPFHAAHGKI